MSQKTRRGLLASVMLLVPATAGAVSLGATRPELPEDEVTPVQYRRYRRVRPPRVRPARVRPVRVRPFRR